MRRVLLTGAGGFVGSHVLRHLLETTDWEIVVTDSWRHLGNMDRIAQQIKDISLRERLRVLAADLRAPFSPQFVYALGDVDYIISVASNSDVDASIAEPRACVEDNVAIVLSLLEYARGHPVKAFVQVSTDEVYGPAPDAYRHREGDPHRPSNPYSASKAAQEDVCFSYWRTFGVPVMVANGMNMIGEMQHPNKFVPSTIAKVLAGDTVQIHARLGRDEHRVGSRFYLHARNFADALVFMLDKLEPAVYGSGGAQQPIQCHVVGEREVSNLEMAQLIARAAGRNLLYQLVDFHSSRPGHDLRYALDGSLLEGLGWRPPRRLEDSLATTVRWTKQHPEWLLGGEARRAA